MFWVGLIIALISGLVGIGLSRDGVKNRFPLVRDFHLDLIAILFLSIGLLVSAIDHLNAEKQLASFDLNSHRINSFEVEFDVQFSYDWSPSTPTHEGHNMIVMGPDPVAKAEITFKDSKDIKLINLFIDKQPHSGLKEDGFIHTTFRVGVEPGAWIMGQDERKLSEVRKLTFLVYGLKFQDSHDGIFNIGAKGNIFVNGKKAVYLESAPQKADLSKLPLGNNPPEMSFDGSWIFNIN